MIVTKPKPTSTVVCHTWNSCIQQWFVMVLERHRQMVSYTEGHQISRVFVPWALGQSGSRNLELYIFTHFRSLIWWFQLLCWMQSMLLIFWCARLWHWILYCCPAFLPFWLTGLSADTQEKSEPEIKDWSKIIPVNQDVCWGSYLFIGSFQDRFRKNIFYSLVCMTIMTY